MAVAGSKTPVSILNELLTARCGRLPTYDLISLASPFKYRVTAGEFFAEGTGPSKQAAKHDAAQKLLNLFNEVKEGHDLTTDMSTVMSPNENLISYNAVGALQDYCTNMNLPMPVYEIVRDEGPAHAKTFTYKCAVSNVIEMRSARTKKQAKHQAAYALLTKLKALYGDEAQPIALKDGIARRVEKNEEQKVNETYLKLSKLHRHAPELDSSLVINQYRAYSRLLDRSATLVKLASNEPYTDPMTVLRDIGSELGVEVEFRKLTGVKTEICIASLAISPNMMRSGETHEEAARLVINSVLSFILA